MKIFPKFIGREVSVLLCLLAYTYAHSEATANSLTSSGELQLLPEKSHQYASVNLDTDIYTSSVAISVAADDVGDNADVYAVAVLNGQWYLKTTEGWRTWDEELSSLVPFSNLTLSSETELELFASEPLLAGDYSVYVAYKVADEEMVVVPSDMRFSIQSASVDTLHRFTSASAMESYLKEALQNTSGDLGYYYRNDVVFATAADSTTGSTASGTNLQVAGVDEADTIKSDGSYLFTLRNCGSTNCVASFRLDAEQAQAEEVGVYQPDVNKSENSFTSAKGMYLIESETDDDLLVTVSGQNNYVPWLSIWGWSSSQTHLEFLNASDPANLSLQESLTFDGSLVASRRIGDVLYLVTRYTPNIPDFIPYAYDESEQQANSELLEATTLTDLLPRVRYSDESSLELVAAESCYLATNAVDESKSPSMITITALPLNDVKNFESSCYLGNSETLYMTPQSLFLATSRYEYSLLATDRLWYEPEHQTAVHKFSLDAFSTPGDTGVTYRGSGVVQGHLGWHEDKRSFRMGAKGENDEYLNIVTSLGSSWGTDSSTRLTVLKETGNELQTVKVIDGIGKPGEQLYAARFLGDRAYLVTFRVIDPLYVIDLSDPADPYIAGELEIEGYSDYLHPISENLLLGIGKDAIPDDGSTDFGFQRGAWYQGVKLSLFDVSDPTQPTEINSLSYGKRGTDSEILYDHHAISYLPATDSRPARFAIPIQLHTTVPDYEWFDPSQPNAYYSFTSRGLYSFEADSSGVEQVGYIEATDANELLRFSPWGAFGDRSLLVDDAVFYVHQGEVLSSTWGATQE
jgi:hypothetical protein